MTDPSGVAADQRAHGTTSCDLRPDSPDCRPDPGSSGIAAADATTSDADENLRTAVPRHARVSIGSWIVTVTGRGTPSAGRGTSRDGCSDADRHHRQPGLERDQKRPARSAGPGRRCSAYLRKQDQRVPLPASHAIFFMIPAPASTDRPARGRSARRCQPMQRDLPSTPSRGSGSWNGTTRTGSGCRRCSAVGGEDVAAGGSRCSRPVTSTHARSFSGSATTTPARTGGRNRRGDRTRSKGPRPCRHDRVDANCGIRKRPSATSATGHFALGMARA